MKDAYQQRRDFVVKRFNDMGLDCHKPEATFYAFPSIQRTGLDQVGLRLSCSKTNPLQWFRALHLAKAGKGFVRASFATSYKMLVEAMDRIELFINKNNLIK